MIARVWRWLTAGPTICPRCGRDCCREKPFTSWRKALQQPGATDYRICTEHGAWHVVK